MPKPEEQRATIYSCAKRVTALDVEVLATQQAHEAATGKLAKIIEIDGELARYADIGSYTQELNIKMQVERKLEQVSAKTSELDSLWSILQEDIRKLADVVEAVMKAEQVCVIGSEEKIEEAKDMFKNVTTF